jgi:hypothetical protein
MIPLLPQTIIQLAISPNGRGHWVACSDLEQIIADIKTRECFTELRAINDRADSVAYARFVRGADGRAKLEADAGVRWAYVRRLNRMDQIIGDMSVWDAFEAIDR